MSNTSLLLGAGCFIVEGFLSQLECNTLVAQAAGSKYIPSRLISAEGIVRLDETYRRTKTANISPKTTSALKNKLVSLIPTLEQHFRTRLTGRENPQLLVYGKGDFFAPHRDVVENETTIVHRRRISVLIFLNRGTDTISESQYSGGNLTLYGLVPHPGWEEIGFSVPRNPGLLIGFPSNTLHEVSRVIEGTRYTIVSWFF